MTREALKEAAMLTMRAAKRRMEKKGLIDMYFVYVRPDGSVEREDVDGSVVNSPEAKSIQFKDAGQRARQTGAEAVIYMSDAWFLDPRGQEYEANIGALGSEVAREIADEVGVVEARAVGAGQGARSDPGRPADAELELSRCGVAGSAPSPRQTGFFRGGAIIVPEATVS